jgi:hypothetical protein
MADGVTYGTLHLRFALRSALGEGVLVATSSVLARRFSELVAQLEAVEATKKFESGHFAGDRVEGEVFLNWKVKARNLLSSACGSASEHYRSFVKAEEPSMYRTNVTELRDLKAVFLAAKEDYEGGYVTSIRALIQAEVFSNELEQARELFANQYLSAAAVVAGVVLETSLRQLCVDKGLSVGKLDKMNADLAKAGTYHLLVQKRITAIADIRNNAAHGHPELFTAKDVEDMISYIEAFLATYL